MAPVPRPGVGRRDRASRVGVTRPAIAQALGYLERDGLVTKRSVGKNRLYRIKTDTAYYPELRSIALKTLGGIQTIAKEVQDDPAIQFAAVFGSFARGDEGVSSSSERAAQCPEIDYLSTYHQAMGTGSATRLYASSIAIVSGVYSIGSAAGAMMSTPMMTDVALGIGGWIMLGLGIVVMVHGIALLTPLADRLGRRSGPLMVSWAVVMLFNQGLSAAVSGWGMPGSRMNGNSMMADTGWDAGMVAIAVLMLVSGLIMSSHASSDTGM